MTKRRNPLRRTASIVRLLAPLAPGPRWRLVVFAIGSLVAGFCEAGVLVLVSQVAFAISKGAHTVSWSFGPLPEVGLRIPSLFALATGLVLLRAAARAVVAWISGRVSADAMHVLRKDLTDAFFDAAWDQQAKESEGHVLDLVGTHVTRITGAMLTATTGATGLFNFAALMVSALLISPVAALSITVTASALFLALRPITRVARGYALKESQRSVGYATAMGEAVSMAQEIRVFDVTKPARERVTRLSATVADAYFRGRVLNKLLTASYETAAVGLVLGGLGLLYAFGSADIASLGALVLIFVRALSYSEGLQNTYHVLDNLLPFIQRINKARRTWERAAETASGDQPLADIEHLAFSKVSFSYVPDRRALEDVSFAVTRGETIGVVGPSGAGKSTFVQVLLRLREPDSGTFSINGTPASEVSMAHWRRQLAYVPQDSRLFEGSVEENVRFFRDQLTRDELERATKLAGIHEEVLSWPDGYATNVGPRGNAISGGQRQRLCLARALAGRPSVIVLDEPTSSLDVNSEALVQAARVGLKGTTTLFIVAHRMSTLKICDRVMVFRNGHLEAFEESGRLLDSNDFFREAAALSQIR